MDIDDRVDLSMGRSDMKSLSWASWTSPLASRAADFASAVPWCHGTVEMCVCWGYVFCSSACRLGTPCYHQFYTRCYLWAAAWGTI